MEPSRKRERERLDKIIREQQRKIAEERRKRREEENAQLIYLTQSTLNQIHPFIDPLVPAAEEKGEDQETRGW